jgi:hypothetical protein
MLLRSLQGGNRQSLRGVARRPSGTGAALDEKGTELAQGSGPNLTVIRQRIRSDNCRCRQPR